MIVVRSFERVRKVWGHNYPKKGEVVKILAIHKHPVHDFWLIIIPECGCELCSLCFTKIKSQFEPISFKEVVIKEQEMVCSN